MDDAARGAVSPPGSLHAFKILPAHRQHTSFSLPWTCSIPLPHFFLCCPGPELEGESGWREEGGGTEEGGKGECAHNKSCMTKLRGKQQQQKNGFSPQRIKRNTTMEMERMNDTKAGTQSINCFILVTSNRATLLSEDTSHTP